MNESKFELTGSAFLFTDNDSFIDKAVLKQKALYTSQAHVIYSFKPGFWVSISTGYGGGGRIIIDREKTAFEVDNRVWAASFGVPIGQSQTPCWYGFQGEPKTMWGATRISWYSAGR